MKKVYALAPLVLFSFSVFAQQGTLQGRVTDKTTGEAIIGATVYITGSTKATSTDVEGNYSLKLDAGIYTITTSYVSYKKATFENVKVEPNKTTTFHLKIEEDAQEMETVTIVGTRQTNTDVALINDIRQSEVVVSGVSGQQIQKSMDRDAAETVKRIPGVTVMNDRFIMVRGLSERYNAVMLNDALTPSSEVDVKAFSFDILPTSVIDRILIYKSGAPELPGEFGGGVIKIHTKNFINENTTNVSLSSSYRAGTTFGNFYRYQGSKTDFLGFDDGTRALPNGFPEHISKSETSLSEKVRQLPANWLPSRISAAPDARLSIGLTRRFNLGEVKVSNVTSVAYTNTRQALSIDRFRYLEFDSATQKSPIESRYTDQQSTENVRLGVLHNWGISFNERHKLEFRHLLNQLGTSRTTIRTGTDFANENDKQTYELLYQSRTIYSGQLQGSHKSRNERTEYTWTTGYNFTHRSTPDTRRVQTQRQLDSDKPYRVVIPNGPTPLDAGRFFSDLSENTVLANGMVEHAFGDSAKTSKIKVRSGFYAEQKERDFDARWMSFVRGNTRTFNRSLAQLPLDKIFAADNINDSTGFKLVEGTNPSDQYQASNCLLAGFVGTSIPVSEQLNVSGGVRVEHNRQQLTSGTFGGTSDSEVKVDNPITNVLPSVNASYNFNLRSLVRVAYSKTVNRPEFRELATFTYYDFDLFAEVKGNPKLKSATIHNLDARYEFYPSANELVSFGAFYKRFINPIETVIEVSNMGNSFTFGNADHATSLGVETEVRKSLQELSESRFVQGLSLVLNASLIKSRVVMPDSVKSQDSDRPLMGQSPYIVNAGVYYQQPEKGWQVTLLYNVIGRRIFSVGTYANPTIYEMPRNVLDLTVTKTLGQHLQLKAGIQDLLNQRVHLIQDSNRDSKINGTDETIWQFRRGRYSTLGLTYTF